MLCGIKLRLDSTAIRQLSLNSDIEFKSNLNLQTGEVDQHRIWSEDGMTIMIKSSGYGYLKGSLHMYKNANLHNYDDFTWKQVTETIQRLSDRVNLQLRDFSLINLEWGLNIPLGFKPDDLLVGLVRHRGAPFEKMYVQPGNHFVANHMDYGVKIYNKSAQHRLKSNLLRFELSCNKSRYVNKNGIFCLADLEDRQTQVQLFHSLISDGWDEVLLIDPLLQDYKPCAIKNQLKVSEWRNPLYWNELNRRVRSYQLKKYEEFLSKYDMQTKEKVKQLMITNFEQL